MSSYVSIDRIGIRKGVENANSITMGHSLVIPILSLRGLVGPLQDDLGPLLQD